MSWTVSQVGDANGQRTENQLQGNVTTTISTTWLQPSLPPILIARIFPNACAAPSFLQEQIICPELL